MLSQTRSGRASKNKAVKISKLAAQYEDVLPLTAIFFTYKNKVDIAESEKK